MRFNYARIDPTYAGGSTVRSGGLLVVPVSGEITFGDSPWSWSGQMSHSDLCEIIRSAARDANISEVLFHVNCVGGSAFALPDIEVAMRELEASGTKSIAAVHGVCLSLAYAIAAMCDEVVSDPASLVGSIGGRMPTLFDYTKQMEEAGVRSFTAKVGALKDFGSGTVPLTDAGKAMYQNMIDLQTEPFFRLVAEHRGQSVESLKQLEASIYAAPMALQHGLIDRIEPFDTTITERVRRSRASSQTRGLSMDIATLKKDHPELVTQLKAEGASEARTNADQARSQPATFEELDSRYGADPAFVQSCLRGKMTLEVAATEHLKRVEASLAAAKTEVDTLKTKLAGSGVSGAGQTNATGSAGVDQSGGRPPQGVSEYGQMCARISAAEPSLSPAQVMHKARLANKSAHGAWEKDGRKFSAPGIPE